MLLRSFQFFEICFQFYLDIMTYVKERYAIYSTLLSHNFDHVISLKNQVGLDTIFPRKLSLVSKLTIALIPRDNHLSSSAVFVIDAVFMFTTCLNRDALESTFEEHLYRASSRDTRVRILRIFAYMTYSTNVHLAGYVSRVRNTREHRFLPLDHSGTRHRNTL